jgi:hypothetical protein
MKSAIQNSWLDYSASLLSKAKEEGMPSEFDVFISHRSYIPNVAASVVLKGAVLETEDWQPFTQGQTYQVIPAAWSVRVEEATIVERQLRAAFGQEQKLADLCQKTQRIEGLVEMVLKKVDRLSPARGGVWIPIQSFAPEPYQSTKPMTAVVMPSDEFFEAALFDLNVYSTGDTQEEAIRGLKSLLLDLYDDLSRKPDEQLGPEPLRQKRFLIEHIARI